jgi:hypothetical protein
VLKVDSFHYNYVKREVAHSVSDYGLDDRSSIHDRHRKSLLATFGVWGPSSPCAVGTHYSFHGVMPSEDEANHSWSSGPEVKSVRSYPVFVVPRHSVVFIFGHCPSAGVTLMVQWLA